MSTSPSTTVPRVTVLMSVYNGRAFLNRSVSSILRQTYRDFEFLVIDNCSADDSYALLESYARQDARIRLLRNDRNVGLAASLNRGLKEARGEFIARMDADDSARPERLNFVKAATRPSGTSPSRNHW